MLKLIKKSLIIVLLVTIDIIVFISKIIYEFYTKNKSKVKEFVQNLYIELKEELLR